MRREEKTDLKDKQITCKICGDTFTFSVGEQEFYYDRQLMGPRRCPQCRQRRQDTVIREEDEL